MAEDAGAQQPAKDAGMDSVREHVVPDPSMEDAPDPDEADLDDLDDMLDDFSIKPAPKEAAKPSAPGRPQTGADDALNLDGLSDDDFAKQLQAGMADFMKEFEQSPDMQSQFEGMLKELGGEALVGDLAAAGSNADTKTALASGKPPVSMEKAQPSTTGAQPPSAGAASVAEEGSFQETIKKNMERMQASGESASAAASSDKSTDFLAEIMKSFQGDTLDSEPNDQDLSTMILGMMEQLTNKEILYEPMKELDDKFPGWMDKNQATVNKNDLGRFKEQQTYVREIVARFELPTYKDENAADRDYIVEKMQKMQATGSPPADLVGDLTAAHEAFGAPEEGCPTQ